MFCEKCGNEMENNVCSNCGYSNAEIKLGDNPHAYDAPGNEEPKNANLVMILGILSFFVGPICSIIALVLGKGYNKHNNYGGSSDMKVGKICAKVSLGLSIVGFILLMFIYGAMFFLAFSSPELMTDPIYDDTIYMAMTNYII